MIIPARRNGGILDLYMIQTPEDLEINRQKVILFLTFIRRFDNVNNRSDKNCTDLAHASGRYKPKTLSHG